MIQKYVGPNYGHTNRLHNTFFEIEMFNFVPSSVSYSKCRSCNEMKYIRSFLLFGASLSLLHVAFGEQDETLEAIWNLTNYAIQSRQRPQIHPNQSIFSNRPVFNPLNRPHGSTNPAAYAGHYNNYQRYPVHPHSPYGSHLHQHPQNQGGYGFLQAPSGHPISSFQDQNSRPWSSFLPTRESFMGALESIARNDELRCVPRILCEVTSGTLSARQNGLQLPFNVNMESIVGLLSSFNGLEVNPLFSFGKAALLGYSSKGNAGTCMYAYPECPRDPERLVEYLNNYNGGFFRFFNGLNPQHQPNQLFGHIPPNRYPTLPYREGFYQATNGYRPNHPPGVYNYKANEAEKRILTRPAEFDSTSNRFTDVRQQKGIKFPSVIDEFGFHTPNNFYNGEPLRTLKFPIRDDGERPPRQPKRFAGYDGAVYQKPLAQRPAQMIFPDRTGTGELKFSPEELEDGPSGFQSNNLVSFENENVNEPIHISNYRPGNFRVYDFRNERRFFPA